MKPDVPPHINLADGAHLPPESAMLMCAERALRDRVRQIILTKPRRHRHQMRREFELMLRESMAGLAQEIDEHGVEAVEWEGLL